MADPFDAYPIAAAGTPGAPPKVDNSDPFGAYPLAPNQPAGVTPREASGAIESLQAGFQGSAPGLAWRGKLPDLVINPEHASWWERALSSAAQVGSELALMIPGAMAGGAAGSAVGSAVPVIGTGVGALLGAGAGMGAVPAAIRQTLIEAYKSGEVMTMADFWNSLREVAKVTAMEAGVNSAAMGAGAAAKLGFATAMGAGPVASKAIGMGTASMTTKGAQTAAVGIDLAAQIAVMPTIPAVLMGHDLDAQSFIDAAILIGGLKAAHVTARNITSVFIRTGKTPAEQVQDAQKNPEVAKDLSTADVRTSEPDYVPPTRMEMLRIQENLFTETARLNELEAKAQAAPLTDAERLDFNAMKARVLDLERQIQTSAPELARTPTYTADQFLEARKLAEARSLELTTKADTGQLTDAERAERVFLNNSMEKPDALAKHFDLEPQIVVRPTPEQMDASAQKIHDDVLRQVRDADEARRASGLEPLGDDHAQAVAALVRARMRTRAERLGMLPEDLYNERPTKIIDETAPEVAAAEAAIPEDAPRFTPPEVDLFGNPVVATNAPRFAVENLITVEVPLANLILSKEVPQFKKDANQAGVIVPLGGTFDRTGVGPIQVWERLNGQLEVISGRHRLDLARRSNEETIPAQIHREADGFDARQAAVLDAELNIREEQGSVADYVQYFKTSGKTREAADELGLLARAKGKAGFAVARDGSDDLVSAHRAGQLSDEAALSISSTAPGSARLQALGIAMVNEGKSILIAVNTMRAVDLMAAERMMAGTQGDIFGFDDSAMREASAMAKKASSKQRQIGEQVAAVSGASKRPELARKMGVNVEDPAAVQAKILELKQEQYLWDNWPLYPELVKQLRGEVMKQEALDPEARIRAVTSYYGTEGARDLAHRARNGDEQAIRTMAADMAENIPPDAVLVPMPSRTGKATVTLQLANAIAEITGNRVADVLEGKPRESQYDAKKRGVPLDQNRLEMTKNGEITEGQPLIIDTVVGTGSTAKAALRAIPEGKVLAHSMDDTAPRAIDAPNRAETPAEATARDQEAAAEAMRNEAVKPKLKKNEEQWYHGTRENIADFSRGGEVYLTDRPIEAGGYALGGHLGGTGTEQPRVYSIAAKKGKIRNIDDMIEEEIMNGNGEIEVALEAGIAKAKAEGARYVEYLHPSFVGDTEQNVRISLYPAEDLRITHQPKDNLGGILFQDEIRNTWYKSALGEAINTANIKSAAAQGWLDMLKGQVAKGGVKADEIKWSGVEDWLKLQEGKVTKEQVADYLASNGVKVEEVMLGGYGNRTPRDQAVAGDVEMLKSAGWKVDTNPDDPGRYMFIDPDTQDFISAGEIRQFAEEQTIPGPNGTMMPNTDLQPIPPNVVAAAERVERYLNAGTEGVRGTKFGTYQLPGGENYRELKLILPGGEFVSSHFPEDKGLLAHIRFNERTDAEGKKVLFIEEIKSDWAQKGKKEGFIDQKQADAARMKELVGQYDAIARRAQQELNAGDATARERASAEQDVLQKEMDALRSKTHTIPTAPFTGKTDAWVSLAMKRMIRYAAENGFDKVAWTRGEQQVERYSSALRKQVDVIEWKKTPEGVQLIGRKGSKGWTGNMQASLDYLDMIRTHRGLDAEQEADFQRLIQRKNTRGDKVVDTTESESALSDSIGKAMADQIRNDPNQTGTIEGDQITVSDTGMAGFYDKIVPKVAKDVLKKLGGGKTDEVSLEIPNKTTQAMDVRSAITRGEIPEFRPMDAMDRETTQGAGDFENMPDTPMTAEVKILIDGEPIDAAVTIAENGLHIMDADASNELMVPRQVFENAGYQWDNADHARAAVEGMWRHREGTMWTQMEHIVGDAEIGPYKPKPQQFTTEKQPGFEITPAMREGAMKGQTLFQSNPNARIEPIKKGQTAALDLNAEFDQQAKREGLELDEPGPALISAAILDQAPVKRVARDTQSRIIGAIAFGSDGQTVEITQLGSITPGTGRELVKIAVQYAQSRGQDVALQSSPEAEGFYERLGFKKVGGLFRLAPKDPLFQNRDQEHRGSYDIAENLVTIMQGADKSTVVHELGHSWLEEMKLDARREGAPDQIRGDWDILRRELAIGEDGEISRASHEQFARSIERYLADGEAPSIGLRGVFERFKTWLLDIYKDLRNLNVEINPELRSVLDRMLATDEEIAQARELGVPKEYAPIAAEVQAERIVPPPAPARRTINPGFAAEQASMHPFADELPAGPGEAPDNIHVNYAYINTPMDVKLAMQRMAEIDQANIQRQRGGTEGVKSWAEANAEQAKYLNDILGGSEDTLHLFEPRDPEAPHVDVRLGILKKLAVGAAKDSARLRDVVLDAGHDATVRQQLEYMGSIERARMIQAEFLGERASVARALNALKDVTEGTGEIGRMLEAIGLGDDGKLFQDRTPAEEQAFLRAKLDEIMQNYKGKSVLDIAKLHKEIGTLKGSFKFTEDVTKATKWEMIVEGWRAGLLSGPVTHTTNLFGTEAFHAMRPAVDALSAIIGMARGASPGMGESDRASMSEAVARITGMLGAVQDGVKVAVATFKLDDPTGKTEAYRTAIPGRAGELIRIPLRLMGAEDALVTTMYERGELRTLAIRQAFDEQMNPSTREFAERVQALIDNPTDAMKVAAETAATRMTFNMPLGEKGVALQGFVNKWNLQWMIPFIRTPINIAKELLRMSPFSPLIGEWRADIAKGGVARDKALAEMALGSGIMALTAAYAFAGNISGAGSPDPGKNRGKAGVWQPYSILVGDKWYEYSRIQPTGTLMGMAADMAAIWDHMTDEEKDKVPRMLSAAFAQAITNQTFLQGISNFVNAMSDPARFGPRFLQQFAGSMVPNVIGQPTTMADPVVREVNSALEAIQARIPGMRQDLLPKRDWLGEPVQTKERVGVILPSRTQDVSTDKVRLEAARLDLSMAAAPKKTHIGKGTGKIGDVKFTPEEQDNFEKIAGEFVHPILTNIVNAPGYDAMPDMIKQRIFREVITAGRRVAAVQALPQDKRMAYLQSITEKITAELQPGETP